MVRRAKCPAGTVEIALAGKYVALHDAYLSVAEALTHGGIENWVKVNIRWVDSETVTDKNAAQVLDGMNGVLVPGSFGSRGIEGKISAIWYARAQGVPFLGLCLGMQVAVVEFARHVCGMADTHSSEFSRTTAHPVIDLMAGQRGLTDKGGTMRLGPIPVGSPGGRAGPLPPTGHRRSASATGTATSSTTTSGRQSPGPVLSWPGCPPMGSWWRWWSCPATPGLWGRSSTRS